MKTLKETRYTAEDLLPMFKFPGNKWTFDVDESNRMSWAIFEQRWECVDGCHKTAKLSEPRLIHESETVQLDPEATYSEIHWIAAQAAGDWAEENLKKGEIKWHW